MKGTTSKTLLLCALACAPLAAQAYVGPGAGLSLLGALWALLLAVGAAIVFLVAWPLRRMRRRRREAMQAQRGGEAAPNAGGSAAKSNVAQFRRPPAKGDETPPPRESRASAPRHK